MKDIILQPNESIILQADNVSSDNSPKGMNELTLTNRRIVHVKRSGFGKVKELRDIPLSQIKIVNGEVQTFFIKGGWDKNDKLQIIMKDGVEIFTFAPHSKKDIYEWINNISIVLTGRQAASIANQKVSSIPYMDDIADSLSAGFGSIKSAFVKETQPTVITRRCIGCHAPINGAKGQTVKCAYCDTENSL